MTTERVQIGRWVLKRYGLSWIIGEANPRIIQGRVADSLKHKEYPRTLRIACALFLHRAWGECPQLLASLFVAPKECEEAMIGDQMDLPFQRHSPTSRAAAKSMEGRAPTLRDQVLEYIRSRGVMGATDQDIQVTLGIPGSTERPRRVELLERHLIRQEGTRKTASGRKAAVWVAC